MSFPIRFSYMTPLFRNPGDPRGLTCDYSGWETGGRAVGTWQTHPHCRNVRPTGVKPMNLVLLRDAKSPCRGGHKIDGWVSLRSPSTSLPGKPDRSPVNRERKLKPPFEVLSVTADRDGADIHGLWSPSCPRSVSTAFFVRKSKQQCGNKLAW